jgi:hypothetical protein
MDFCKISFSIISKILLLYFIHISYGHGQNVSSISKINNLVTCPNFTTRFCVKNKNTITLDSFSLEGIKGYWTPQIINIDTIIGNKFSSRWTTLDISSLCTKDTVVDFTFDYQKNIDFNIPQFLCKKFGTYLLPMMSLDSVKGTWNISRLNTDTLSLGIIPLQFIPDAFCIDTFRTQIEIVDFIYPKFDIKTKLCISDDPFDLPLVSVDGVSGVWTERTIIPTIISQNFVSIFTPSIAYRDCYVPLAVTFEVYNKLKPEFTMPDYVCFSNTALDYINISNNDISGSWGVPSIDNTVINNPVLRNTFIPDKIDCHEILVIEIPIISFSHLSVDIVSPSNCGVTDGMITLMNSKANDQFSIDGGNTWQSSPTFTNLASGAYKIHLRSVMDVSCVDSLMCNIPEPPSPIILSVETFAITDCTFGNGSANCIATGDHLEYSLDGIIWQSSSSFQNLASGNYNIFVRNKFRNNCTSSISFDLSPAPIPKILDIQITNLTSCNSNDGIITISAIGQNLVYSLDNGLSFQSSPQFTNLPLGDFDIVVSSASLMNCRVDTAITIKSPLLPSITSIIKENPSDCGSHNGKISVDASGEFLEYSIDNGFSWSEGNTFTDLMPGDYRVLARNKNSTDCFVDSTVTIDSLRKPHVSIFETSNPSTCISSDGKVILDIDNPDTECSIDNGLTWVTLRNFDNLSEGKYDVLVRIINTRYCVDSVHIEIVDPPCPCLPLEIDAEVKLVHCPDSLTGKIIIDNISGFFTNEAFTFKWNDSGLSNYEYFGLGQGWYSYTIEYDRNCTWKDSIFIGTTKPLNFDLDIENETCKKLGSIEVINLNGGSGSYIFLLDDQLMQDVPFFDSLYAKKYTVVVKDSLGCSSQKEIILEKLVDLDLDIPEQVNISYGTFANLTPIIYPTDIDTFEWAPKDHLSNPFQLIVMASPPEMQEYSLTIFLGTCQLTKSILVNVLPSEEIFFPNVISINSVTGNNEFYFKTDTRNVAFGKYLKIFDRWGNLIFFKRDFNLNSDIEGWDGSYYGRLVDSGVYPFIAEIVINGKPKILNGVITVVR